MTESLESVLVSIIMKVWLARELSVQRTALEEDYVSLRNFWEREQTLLGLDTLLSGMLINTLDACAIWDSEDQIAPFKNAHPVLMFFWEAVTTREEIAPEEESATTRKDYVSAFLDTSGPDVSSKPSSDKQFTITFVGLVWGIVEIQRTFKAKGVEQKNRKIVRCV